MKDENGDLLTDSYNILCRWKKQFIQLMNVPHISDVRQVQVQEPLVPVVLRLKLLLQS
jgi:hypothetical protein